MRMTARNENRRKPLIHGLSALCFVALLAPLSLSAQGESSKEKQDALDWLSQPEVLRRFGGISDAIWSYAELGLQEHKSSGTVDQDARRSRLQRWSGGWRACRPVLSRAGASGKPVVGILAEYDALPMLSQKGRTAEAGARRRRGAGARLRAQSHGARPLPPPRSP